MAVLGISEVLKLILVVLLIAVSIFLWQMLNAHKMMKAEERHHRINLLSIHTILAIGAILCLVLIFLIMYALVV